MALFRSLRGPNRTWGRGVRHLLFLLEPFLTLMCWCFWLSDLWLSTWTHTISLKPLGLDSDSLISFRILHFWGHIDLTLNHMAAFSHPPTPSQHVSSHLCNLSIQCLETTQTMQLKYVKRKFFDIAICFATGISVDTQKEAHRRRQKKLTGCWNRME